MSSQALGRLVSKVSHLGTNKYRYSYKLHTNFHVSFPDLFDNLGMKLVVVAIDTPVVTSSW